MILINEIVAETKTDRIWLRLKKQTYDDKNPHYCVLKDWQSISSVELSSGNIKDLLKHLNLTVSQMTKSLKSTWQNKETLKVTKDCILDYKEFIQEVSKI